MPDEYFRLMYELLDFGDGRKLERVAGLVLDRPAQAAQSAAPQHLELWSSADARYERGLGTEGRWQSSTTITSPWNYRRGALTLQLRFTPFGHIGLFPEQAENWDWITAQLAAASESPKVLNLFAYTGGSTLAAAAAGAQVTHIDSAKNVLAWARNNAELSGLGQAPIRWITEDARKFVQRELRRGNRYDAVILDPPSYGHGPSGQTWKLESDLPQLLGDCRKLLAEDALLLLLSCHTEGQGPRELALHLKSSGFSNVATNEMSLTTGDGRRLPSGVVAQWSRPS